MKTPSLRFAPLAILAAVGLIALAPVAKADWNPGDPYKMHYPQLPDLTPNGLDILATYGGPWGNKILADDFLCTQTGPITDIHIWGSWLANVRDPNARFHLSIHADIPAGVGLPYSTPGAALWQMDLFPTQQRLYDTAQTPEQFLDPNSGSIIGADTEVWQYNFIINPAQAFAQQESTIYWLDVQYIPDPFFGAAFGWKTSISPHFQDDAVFGDNVVPGGLPSMWEELIYPIGQSRDLAFVITIPEPSELALVGAVIAMLVVFRRRK